MRRFLGTWAGIAMQDLVSNVTTRITPSHPILALFCFSAALLFFFALIVAFVIGAFIGLSHYFAQDIAIWVLFGSLLLLLVIFLILGRLFLKPKKFKPASKALAFQQKEASLQDIIIAFIEGFISR